MSRNVAVLIGCNYHNVNGGQYKLNGCHNDATEMKTFLKQKGYTTISLLDTESATSEIKLSLSTSLDSLQEPTYFPTTNNIVNLLNHLAAVLTARDKLFLYYSGHGSYTRSTSEKDRQDEALVVYGTKDNLVLFLDNTVNAILRKFKAKVNAAFDSCHSATVTDLQNTYRAQQKQKPQGVSLLNPFRSPPSRPPLDGNLFESAGHLSELVTSNIQAIGSAITEISEGLPGLSSSIDNVLSLFTERQIKNHNFSTYRYTDSESKTAEASKNTVNIFALSGCDDNSFSYETTIDGRVRGLFTCALLLQINNNHASMTHFTDAVYQTIRSLSSRVNQVPSFSASGNVSQKYSFY